MKFAQSIIILIALSIAVGFRAAELAQFTQKPNGGYNTGNIKSFVGGAALQDATAKQRVLSVYFGSLLMKITKAVEGSQIKIDRFCSSVGLWYGLWFAATLLVLWSFGYLVWFMVFSGVIASSLFMAAYGSWCWDVLPWDGPVLFFAALATVTRKPIVLFLALIVGMLFKETIIVFSILFLFFPNMEKSRRINLFAISLICCVIERFAISCMINAGGSFGVGYVISNIKWMFGLNVNTVFLAGGGILLAWFLSRPRLKYTLIAGIFCVAIFVCSSLPELRHFNELIPMASIGLFNQRAVG